MLPVSHSSLPAQRHARLTLRLPDCQRMLVPMRIDGLTVQTGARWIDEVPCGNEAVCLGDLGDWRGCVF